MAKLTSKERNSLDTKEFAVPSQRKYPIEDVSHGRNALSRVSQFGSSALKSEVREKVYKKFPELRKNKD